MSARVNCHLCGEWNRVVRTVNGQRTRVCRNCGPASRQGRRPSPARYDIDVSDCGKDRWLANRVALWRAVGADW